MARQTRLNDHSQRGHQSPEESKKEPKKFDITPPREELGTSEEIILSGKIYYAHHGVPNWPGADSAREYIATPEDMQEIQHGVVTYIDAAESDKEINELYDRRLERTQKKVRKADRDLTL
mgnify:CR=1 FL=1